MIPEHVMIPGLMILNDEPMLRAASSFDSLESDCVSMPCAASIDFVATPTKHHGIQRAHSSILGGAMLLGIIPAEETVELRQKVRCDSWYSVQSEDLHDFLDSSPALVARTVAKGPLSLKRKTTHRRSQFTLVGSEILVNEY